jgi:molybdopterin-synthase adenylyltransferase
MERPLLYFQPSELQELAKLGREHTQPAAAVAFCKGESEAVYHVHWKPPRFRQSGQPLRTFIWVSERVQGEPFCRRWMRETLLAELPVVAKGGESCLLLFAHPERPEAVLGFLSQTPGRPGEDVQRVDCQPFPGFSELFARHEGLLETALLQEKRVFIVGLGSFGAPLALQLAMSGVGHFTLVDPDRLEAANLSRHPCGLEDLGRFKTLAVRDALLRRNPDAVVRTLELDFNGEGADWEAEVRASDLLIGLTDENRSRFRLNRLALAVSRPAFFARAITRAAGGDIFRFRPGGGPCLACLFSQGAMAGSAEVSTLRQARREAPAYMKPEETEATVQPGLATDIAPIVTMTAKLVLLELLGPRSPMGNSLQADLEAPFYIWANRRELIYKNWPPMGMRFDRNSILRWYGVRCTRDPDCMVCGLQG